MQFKLPALFHKTTLACAFAATALLSSGLASAADAVNAANSQHLI